MNNKQDKPNFHEAAIQSLKRLVVYSNVVEKHLKSLRRPNDLSPPSIDLRQLQQFDADYVLMTVRWLISTEKRVRGDRFQSLLDLHQKAYETLLSQQKEAQAV